RASLKPAPAAAGAVRARMRPLARAPSRVRGEAPVGRGGRARLKAAVLKTARVASPREFESPPLRLAPLAFLGRSEKVSGKVSGSPPPATVRRRGRADPFPLRPARSASCPASPCI